MAKIIAIINSKGGTGKTTTCVNLASFLTASGKSVLILDLDSEASASRVFGLSVNKAKGLAWAMANKRSMIHAINKTNILGCDIAGLGKMQKTKNLINKLKNILPAQSRIPYDFILIDCAPDLEWLTLNAMNLAQHILIPVQAEYFALDGLVRLLKKLEHIKKEHNLKFNILGILLTMFDPRNNLAHQVIKKIKKKYRSLVFKTIIPRNVKLAEAPGSRKTILQYAPRSSGARAYRDLAREILNS